MNQICSLCDESKPLIAAHIIPEFFYKILGLYGNNSGQGRIKKATIVNHEFHINKKGIPLGIYDNNILCKECDNFINKEYENYSKSLLFDTSGTNVELSNELIIFKGIDYIKFKLFVLSIFWRASISIRPEFKNIKLQLEIENKLKSLIKNKDSVKPSEFSVITCFLYAPQLLSNTISDIMTFNNNGVLTYAFFAGGLLFYLYNDLSNVPENLLPYVLNDNGNLTLLKIPEKRSIEILKMFYS
ncbi:MAG: hypothetical protein A2X08_16805 [Bacteroidetes bacterium GWA2_32_17]|nr:MAG: hypothetical protein A2X08_16805 [Bacteroidetes bacterium GWA2_32_17]